MTQPTGPVTTRPFVAGDLSSLYAIEESCFAPSVRFSRTLIRSLATNGECRVWVGLVGEVVASFAILALHSEEDPTIAYIWTIEVLPAFRRKGLAHQLLRRVEESARAAACIAITLHVSERNFPALALYEAAGFIKLSLEPAYYSLREDAFLYRKDL